MTEESRRWLLHLADEFEQHVKTGNAITHDHTKGDAITITTRMALEIVKRAREIAGEE